MCVCVCVCVCVRVCVRFWASKIGERKKFCFLVSKVKSLAVSVKIPLGHTVFHLSFFFCFIFAADDDIAVFVPFSPLKAEKNISRKNIFKSPCSPTELIVLHCEN